MSDGRADDSDSDLSAFLGANVPPSMLERVRTAAHRADRTVSSWLRQAVRRQLDAEKRLRERAEAPSQ